MRTSATSSRGRTTASAITTASAHTNTHFSGQRRSMTTVCTRYDSLTWANKMPGDHVRPRRMGRVMCFGLQVYHKWPKNNTEKLKHDSRRASGPNRFASTAVVMFWTSRLPLEYGTIYLSTLSSHLQKTTKIASVSTFVSWPRFVNYCFSVWSLWYMLLT